MVVVDIYFLRCVSPRMCFTLSVVSLTLAPQENIHRLFGHPQDIDTYCFFPEYYASWPNQKLKTVTPNHFGLTEEINQWL